ncbi:MAG: CinA family protein, partial [Chloroflexi bacterium]|nr:CinA family protein [Chloroflexota bacterium]
MAGAEPDRVSASLLAALRAQGLSVAVAESGAGGLIAARLTSAAG